MLIIFLLTYIPTGIFMYAGCNALRRVLKHGHSAKQALPSVTLGKPTFTANYTLCRHCLTAKRHRTVNPPDAESRSRQRVATWHARPQQTAPSVTVYFPECGSRQCTCNILFLCVCVLFKWHVVPLVTFISKKNEDMLAERLSAILHGSWQFT